MINHQKFLYYTKLASIARKLSCLQTAKKWENKATDIYYQALNPLGNKYSFTHQTQTNKEPQQ